MSQTQSLPYEPIYRKLFEQYRDAIVAKVLQPGSRIDSLSTIQRRHRVSRETAKLVLRRLKAQGYIVQRQGKGSFVAGPGARKPVWAIVLPFFSAQYEDLLQELSKIAASAGRQIEHFLDHNKWEEEIRIVGSAIREGYEAVILIPTLDEAKTASFYSKLSPGETFIALIDHTMTGSYFPYVVQSYDLGIQRGLHYFTENGCRNVALVKGNLWARNNRLQALVEETFRETARNFGCENAPVFAGLQNITKSRIEADRIDGLFCLDDTDAVRIIGRLRAQGIRIPEHLRLVSYGNSELAQYFTPAITSVDPHNADMARKAGEIIAMHLQGQSTQMLQFVVQPEIVIRNT